MVVVRLVSVGASGVHRASNCQVETCPDSASGTPQATVVSLSEEGLRHCPSPLPDGTSPGAERPPGSLFQSLRALIS